MNIHWLQHVDFEGLGCIEPWLTRTGHDVTCTRLWAGDGLPATADVDGLIVMGGPMGISDDKQYPWLIAEKAFIKNIIDQNKPVLGICLGAQLIAEVLGSRVWKNEHKEIGFYECRASVPLALNDRDGRSAFLPDQFFPLHWHGDTFGIPDGAVRLASSEATENQAFVYNDNVLALQFHLETTEQSLLTLYENARDEIADAPFIQTLEEMRPFFPTLGNCNELMFHLLNRLF
jgi:GMP synthase (glutamine-hydrolysing)